ncbi:enoyl-CoA hydratase/isomerase family protein [Natrononativus amylolyticus]|uniref:enoyl-CoA hydratase/isomerase family protein n=1 Tax=Natrononativus amylolyticus TaxID=2963434 RepID=UPI0020CE28CC|nr:enoyl-CoA hydratase/isomerase family protein [Natrononativus amylolyticus]
MAHALIETTESDGHVHITLANEEKPNPINAQLQKELNSVLGDLENDESVRVVSITGQGSSFAVGADISEMHGWLQNKEWDELMRFLRSGQELMSRISDLPVPTLASINGYALGGGLELALACDLRFASRSATVGFPEINLGMIPGWGGTQRLPNVVGQSTAKDILLTGRHIDSESALEMGLIDRVTADDQLDETVDDYAATIVEKPSHTTRYMLDAVEASKTDSTEMGLSHELMCDMFASFPAETTDRVESFMDRS